MVEESNKSLFNAGIGQAQQVRELQNTINLARLNPMGVISPDFSPNYMVAFTCITSCWLEVKPKCLESERTNVERIKELIENYITLFPVVNKKGMVNQKNLNSIVKLLELYESKVRESLERHELNSPSKADYGKAVAEM
jgi:hypothetical protein